MPMLLAGFLVAAKIAVDSGMPNSMAFFMQPKRLVADPAMVPSERAANRFFIYTACPPSSYSPSGIPVAIIESLIRHIRSSPNILKAARIMEGWI